MNKIDLDLDTTILNLEKKVAFDFFWKETNDDEKSSAYGLIRDNSFEQHKNMASIAANGFGFAALVIGVENGYISRESGERRTLGTLKTFLNSAENFHGFFYHFLDMKTAKRFEAFYDCPSIIDTSLLVSGMIVAGEYFGGEVKALVAQIYEQIDWTLYVNPETKAFYMGYNVNDGGFGAWNMYAEQLIQYILGAGSENFAIEMTTYDSWSRKKETYKDYEFMTAPRNALFTHQYSHAWFDFSKFLDKDGIDFAENTKQVTLAAHAFAIQNQGKYKTFNAHSWGQAACEGPFGYRAYGSGYDGMTDEEMEQDGTIAPTAASGSLVFTPELSIDAMNYMSKLPDVWGEYGLVDSYNFDVLPHYVCHGVIGIDKGITMLMIENYQSGLIWKLFMQNEAVKKGIERLGFVSK